MSVLKMQLLRLSVGKLTEREKDQSIPGGAEGIKFTVISTVRLINLNAYILANSH